MADQEYTAAHIVDSFKQYYENPDKQYDSVRDAFKDLRKRFPEGADTDTLATAITNIDAHKYPQLASTFGKIKIKDQKKPTATAFKAGVPFEQYAKKRTDQGGKPVTRKPGQDFLGDVKDYATRPMYAADEKGTLRGRLEQRHKDQPRDDIYHHIIDPASEEAGGFLDALFSPLGIATLGIGPKVLALEESPLVGSTGKKLATYAANNVLKATKAAERIVAGGFKLGFGVSAIKAAQEMVDNPSVENASRMLSRIAITAGITKGDIAKGGETVKAKLGKWISGGKLGKWAEQFKADEPTQTPPAAEATTPPAAAGPATTPQAAPPAATAPAAAPPPAAAPAISEYDQAAKLVQEAGKGSAQLLQRKMKLPYNRAVEVLNQLEKRGILEPGNNGQWKLKGGAAPAPSAAPPPATAPAAATATPAAAATPPKTAPAAKVATPTVTPAATPAPKAAATPAPAVDLKAKLPLPLAGAKPKYKTFDLDFASDVDRAAYIAGNPKSKSAKDAGYLEFAKKALRTDEAGVQAYGRKISDYLRRKSESHDASGGDPIRVPPGAAAKTPEAAKPAAPAAALPKPSAAASGTKSTPKPAAKPTEPAKLPIASPKPKLESVTEKVTHPGGTPAETKAKQAEVASSVKANDALVDTIQKALRNKGVRPPGFENMHGKEKLAAIRSPGDLVSEGGRQGVRFVDPSDDIRKTIWLDNQDIENTPETDKAKPPAAKAEAPPKASGKPVVFNQQLEVRDAATAVELGLQADMDYTIKSNPKPGQYIMQDDEGGAPFTIEATSAQIQKIFGY